MSSGSRIATTDSSVPLADFTAVTSEARSWSVSCLPAIQPVTPVWFECFVSTGVVFTGAGQTGSRTAHGSKKRGEAQVLAERLLPASIRA
jgi:hypothetical protein